MSADQKDVRTLSATDYAAAKAAVTGGFVKPVSTGISATEMTVAEYRAAKAAILKPVI